MRRAREPLDSRPRSLVGREVFAREQLLRGSRFEGPGPDVDPGQLTGQPVQLDRHKLAERPALPALRELRDSRLQLGAVDRL